VSRRVKICGAKDSRRAPAGNGSAICGRKQSQIIIHKPDPGHYLAQTVDVAPLFSLKHFDVSGIAETWKRRAEIEFPKTLNMERPPGHERLEPDFKTGPSKIQDPECFQDSQDIKV
jgi:hypothetical protein